MDAGFQFRRSGRLRGVSSVALACVVRDPDVVDSVQRSLLSDLDFGHGLLNIDGRFLNKLNIALLDNEGIIELALCSGFTLRGAREDLRAHRGLVAAAVAQRGFDLQYASVQLRSDRQIALVAVQQYGLALQWVGVLLRNERKIVEAALRQDRRARRFAGAHLQHDA